MRLGIPMEDSGVVSRLLHTHSSLAVQAAVLLSTQAEVVLSCQHSISVISAEMRSGNKSFGL